MKPEEVFEVFRETKALLSGHFELRSGLHSDQYFQCALALQSPRVAERLCRALTDKLRAGRGRHLRADGVIAPAMGGLFVGYEIARALDVRSIFAEKDGGKLVLRRAFEIHPGQRFVIAEDVMTRGGRIQETMDLVTARGGEVEAIVVPVDRSGGRACFPYPVISLLQWEPATWPPGQCPLCAQGSAAVHPGS